MLSCDRDFINADGEDVLSVTASVVDARGRAVPTADNLIDFDVTGPAKMLGVGNGDPSSHESEKSPNENSSTASPRASFNATGEPGEIVISATSAGLRGGHLSIRARRAAVRPAVP